MTSTGVRRSSRERRQAHSIYDDAAEQRQARETTDSAEKPRRKKRKKEDDSEDEQEEEDVMEVSSEEEEDDTEDEEEEEAPPTTRKRKSPASSARKPTAKPRKIAARLDKKSTKSNKARAPKGSNKASQKSISSALAALAKKVLHPSETPETSLVAALLEAHKQDGKAKKKGKQQAKDTVYTLQLEKTARQVIQEHQDDPNKAQIDLVNLLARAVGGGLDTLLDDQETDMGHYSDEELSDFLTNVAKDMKAAPIEQVLFCANPKGAMDGLKATVASGLGTREFRKIYEEFWYRLGLTALSSSTSQTKAKKKKGDNDNEDKDDDSESEDDDDSSQEIPPTDSSRFQVEMVREIMNRMLELTTVNVDDFRAGTTVAVYGLVAAMLEKTVDLNEKLKVANRQLNVAKRAKMSRKAQALKEQVDGWTRTNKELEQIVSDAIAGVFIHRHMDTNMHIRATSIDALSEFTRIRPDFFLRTKYVKYTLWALHDRAAVVRESGVSGILATFKASEDPNSKQDFSDLSNIMSEFVLKFGNRIAECTMDVEPRVQEKAMELLLVLSRHGLLDALDEEDVWSQINHRALADDASPAVRRDSLLFVIDQLEAFDSEADSEASAALQINALASWVAHALADGPIPNDRIRFERTAYIVASLRSSPEHQAIAYNFSALLRALQTFNKPTRGNSPDARQSRRQEEAQRRVLLEMLIAAAKQMSQDFPEGIVDDDFIAARHSKDIVLEPSSKKQKKSGSREDFTVALLRALPGLLSSFKTETTVVQSLTSLPLYFLPSVFSLSTQKKNFSALLGKLSEIFLESTDISTLNNCCLSITFLANGDHARSDEALLKLKQIVGSLRDRLLDLYKEKAKLLSSEEDEENYDESVQVNTESAISLSLRRLSVISKRWPIGRLLVEDETGGRGEEETEQLFTVIGEAVAKDLKARKVSYEGEDEDEIGVVPEIWKQPGKEIHALVADSVEGSLSLLLSIVAWACETKIKELEDDDEGAESDVSHVLRMRDRLFNLLIVCFEQFVENKEDGEIFSKEHLEFSLSVQKSATSAASGLRQLFPKEWANTGGEHRGLRSLALTDDSRLIGGFVRFFRSQEKKLRAGEEGGSVDKDTVRSTLLPLARETAANWKAGNRREAAAALPFMTSDQKHVSDLVSAMSKAMKKIDPVRLLEAQLVCLRQEYEDWARAEPEEPESDSPAEEEMEVFEEAEKEHKEKFESIEHLAQRLSSSLGVGKLSDAILPRVLLAFVREGVRYAFSTEDADSGEAFFLGARLSFLRVLSKYLNWVRKDKGNLEILRNEFNEKEVDLRRHPDFGDVYEDDLTAIGAFRKAGGLGTVLVEDEPTEMEDSVSDDQPSSAGFRHRRMSHASSISSVRSKVSTQPSLPPLPEEDGDEESDEEAGDEDSSSLSSTRRRLSADGSLSTHTTQMPIAEESEEDTDSDGD